MLFLGATLHGTKDPAVNARHVLARRVPPTGSEHVVTPMALDKRLLYPNISLMPVEVQVYLAKWVPNPRRMEPKNIGVCVLTGTGEFDYRFLASPPEGTEEKEYREVVKKWIEALGKYGHTALKWVGKKRGRYYIEFAHGELVQTFDFDDLYEELVL